MYERSRTIETFYIAGFQYHEGADVIDKLKIGTKLELVPEFDNPYDPNAIALKYKGVHLGYVPRDKNWMLAMLLAFGHDDVVRCKVIQRDKKAPTREQIKVKLYLKDKRAASKSEG